MNASTALVRVPVRKLSRSGVAALRRRMIERAIDEAAVGTPRLWLEALEPRRMMDGAFAQAALNADFGVGGHAVLPVPAGQYVESVTADSIVPAPDGSLYVQADVYYDSNGSMRLPDGHYPKYPNGQLAVAHFFANGQPDVGFGQGGWAIVDSGAEWEGRKLKLLPDGKLMIFDGGDNLGFNDPVSITRLNANGTLDATFGVGGVFTATDSFDTDSSSFGNLGGYTQVWVDAAGRINLFGLNFSSDDPGTVQSMWLRLNPDGTPDTSWSTQGPAISSVASFRGRPDAGDVALASQPLADGDVLTYVESNFFTVNTNSDDVTRLLFNSSGALVSSQVVVTDTASPEVREQADGSAWIVGAGNQLLHVRSDGTIDTNVDPTDGDGDYFFDVSPQTDGRVIAIGVDSTNQNAVFRRFNPDGSPDTTFAAGLTVGGIPRAAWQTAAESTDGSIVIGQYWPELGPALRLVELQLSGGTSAATDGGAGGETTDVSVGDPAAMTEPYTSSDRAVVNAGGGLFADATDTSVWNPAGDSSVFA